jgi:Inhibitor of Apoptosis domain/Zinc finger, C3HC4 type (RING finger)
MAGDGVVEPISLFWYNFGHLRLKTFEADLTLEAELLSSHGFYYRGKDSAVTCIGCFRDFQCRGAVNPRLEHSLETPGCRVLRVTLGPFTCEFGGLRSGAGTTFNSSAARQGFPSSRFGLPALGFNDLVERARALRRTIQQAVDMPHGVNARRARASRGRVSNEPTDFLGQRMRFESNRVLTFTNWPIPWLSALTMARSGFFYTGVGDQCECGFCGGVVASWPRNMTPMEVHSRDFPMCPFILGDRSATTISDDDDVISQPDSHQESLASLSLGTYYLHNSSTQLNQRPITQPNQALLCKICLCNELTTLFKPCNHLIVCDECSPRFNSCPVCRENINEKQRVFL